MKQLPFTIFIVGIFLNVNVLYGQPVNLDSTFGTNGLLFPDFGIYDYANDVLIQPDEKIVVLGGSNEEIIVLRFNSGGLLDSSFSDDGISHIGTPGYSRYGISIALQTDNKLVIGGYSKSNAWGADYDFQIVRLLASGTIDSSYGLNGFVTTDFADDHDYILDIALNADGKVSAVGHATIDGDWEFAIARYLNSGLPDSTFNQSGTFSLDLGADNYQSFNIVGHQADGKTIVGGNGKFEGVWQMVLLRFLENGEMDTTFSNGGYFMTDSDTGEKVFDIAVLPDGKLLLSGSIQRYDQEDALMYKLEASGALDLSFGLDGKMELDVNGKTEYPLSLAIDTSGRIILGGFLFGDSFPETDLFLIRLDQIGFLDTTFNSEGFVISDLSGFNDEIYAIALQDDGKIVAVGNTLFTSDNDMEVARFTQGIGTLLNDLKSPGIALTVFPNPASDFVFLRFTSDKQMTVSLFDLSGKLISKSLEETVSGLNSYKFKLPDFLMNGTYILSVQNSTISQNIKLNVFR